MRQGLWAKCPYCQVDLLFMGDPNDWGEKPVMRCPKCDKLMSVRKPGASHVNCT